MSTQLSNSDKFRLEGLFRDGKRTHWKVVELCKVVAPVQAGGWECGHYVALLVQQLLLGASHGVPFSMMAFSFGLQELGCLKRSLLHAVLLQSTTALKAMCTAGRDVGTPCAFLVADLK